jgi:CheY-like chemotaxis protein
MSDDLSSLIDRRPNAARPLGGQTILLVEDSRFASEAMRLTCLHLGGRIRRADCLQSARRHLMSYRPTAALIDLGLPDGSGLDLIADLARVRPRIGALIAISGSPELRQAALDAGADAFLDKPLTEVGAVRRAILAAQGADPGAATQPALPILPDRLALRDDLIRAVELLDHAPLALSLGYVAQFLGGVAAAAADRPLADAAKALAADDGAAVARAADLLHQRLAQGVVF